MAKMNNYTTNLYGSNFRTGFTAGRIQIPTETSPGVPVGLPNAYTIFAPKYRQDIYQINEVTLSSEPYYLPISQFSTAAGTFEQVDSNNRMYKFDYSRMLGVSLRSMSVSTNVNVFISYFDIYGKEGFFQLVLDEESEAYISSICCLGISSMYLTADATTEVEMVFGMENQFELPYTDNGVFSQLLLVSGNRTTAGLAENSLWIATINDSEPYGFSWDGNYLLALTDPPTLTLSRVRPNFEILKGGEFFGESISNYVFSFQQNVYGLGNGTQWTSENYPQIGTQTLESKYVFGQPNYTKGFLSWRG
jgi:hypothetical protein